MDKLDNGLVLVYWYLLGKAQQQKKEYDRLRDEGNDDLASALYERLSEGISAYQVVGDLIKESEKKNKNNK